jgi:ABC-type amino acid transport substrate-binding protein
MHDTLSDRQARTVILAAEALGFEREPDLDQAWHDLDLHEDAAYAVRYLKARDPDALRAAMVAEEPIPANVAAERITDSGRFTNADVDLAVELATELGWAPPNPDVPLDDWIAGFEQAQLAVAWLWEHHQTLLIQRLGATARLAPLPASGPP